jgi:hypothetical protein
MPNVEPASVAAASPLPHVVHLQGLSLRALGERFGPAFDACRQAACAAAGEGWTTSAVHEPGRGTSYVFRFACPMASLRFSARAVMAIARYRSWPACWTFD